MKIISNNNSGIICRKDTIFSSTLFVRPNAIDIPDNSTGYGIVLNGNSIIDGIQIPAGYAFCAKTKIIGGSFIVVVRYGVTGQTVIGVEVESGGRLKYIDGCTDTVLIYPPKLGYPSLNSLHFPPNTDQTFHTHDSIRMGVILSGSGVASTEQGEIELNVGDAWCIEENERHRFKSTNGMTVIAFHPDGDWGPSDHTHPMINKTKI